MIRYTDSTIGITPEMLKRFFRGWKRARTPEEHIEILKNSSRVVLAIDTETNRVVGYIMDTLWTPDGSAATATCRNSQ